LQTWIALKYLCRSKVNKERHTYNFSSLSAAVPVGRLGRQASTGGFSFYFPSLDGRGFGGELSRTVKGRVVSPPPQTSPIKGEGVIRAHLCKRRFKSI